MKIRTRIPIYKWQNTDADSARRSQTSYTLYYLYAFRMTPQISLPISGEPLL